MRYKTMTNSEKALQMHETWNGKIETTAKSHVNSREDLAIAYTPGVAEPCKVIAKNPDAAYKYTIKANTIAVVSDGSAVLGLGNIGAKAAMPVMEGKAVLFKEFGGVNAVPICLDTQDTEEIIRTVVNIAPAFGGINLEDISAPRCFEIEERLKELLDIPVFHDDQHGTAIVVLAGIINALKVTGKKRKLPGCDQRCRICRGCHHKITFDLWVLSCDHVRYQRNHQPVLSKSELDAETDGGSHQSGRKNRHSGRRFKRRGYLRRRLCSEHCDTGHGRFYE